MRGFWLSFRTEDFVDIYHVHFREVGDLVHAYAMKTTEANYAFSAPFDSLEAAERGVVLYLQDTHPGIIPTKVLFLGNS
jgi:hypothetical protein